MERYWPRINTAAGDLISSRESINSHIPFPSSFEDDTDYEGSGSGDYYYYDYYSYETHPRKFETDDEDYAPGRYDGHFVSSGDGASGDGQFESLDFEHGSIFVASRNPEETISSTGGDPSISVSSTPGTSTDDFTTSSSDEPGVPGQKESSAATTLKTLSWSSLVLVISSSWAVFTVNGC